MVSRKYLPRLAVISPGHYGHEWIARPGFFRYQIPQQLQEFLGADPHPLWEQPLKVKLAKVNPGRDIAERRLAPEMLGDVVQRLFDSVVVAPFHVGYLCIQRANQNTPTLTVWLPDTCAICPGRRDKGIWRRHIPRCHSAIPRDRRPILSRRQRVRFR